MDADSWLALFIVVVVGLTTYGILTNTTTPEERDAMLADEEMWP